MMKRIPTSCSQFSSIDRELADVERDGQFYISAVREEPIFPPNNNNVSFELFEYITIWFFVQHLKTEFANVEIV